MKVAKSHLAVENAIPCSKDTYKLRNKVGNYPMQMLHSGSKCMLILLPHNVDLSGTFNIVSLTNPCFAVVTTS